MPTGYTAPVGDGFVTDLKDFAQDCARAFGAFIHQRDDGKVALRWPPHPFGADNFYTKKLRESRLGLLKWENMSEEERYNAWSDYYEEKTCTFAEVTRKRAKTRANYKNMLAQVRAVDVDPQLQNFKDFMIEQLESSIRFDCPEDDSFTVKWYTPKSYVEWCEWYPRDLEKQIERYRQEQEKEIERYYERIAYIELLIKTYGIEVE